MGSGATPLYLHARVRLQSADSRFFRLVFVGAAHRWLNALALVECLRLDRRNMVVDVRPNVRAHSRDFELAGLPANFTADSRQF